MRVRIGFPSFGVDGLRRPDTPRSVSVIGRLSLRTFGHFAQVVHAFSDGHPDLGSGRHGDRSESAIRKTGQKICGNYQL